MTAIAESVERKHYIHSKTGYTRRIRTNAIMMALTGLCTLFALIPLFWILIYVSIKGASYINLDFFIKLPTPVGIAGGGVLNAIEGTFLLILISAVISIPLGLLAAIYTAYHPNTPLGTAVRFSTDVLSGVPTIITGIFCYAVIVVPQKHYSALAGGVALAIIMLPIIIRTTEEMIKMVPNSMREGSLALGAQEWKTTFKVTLPAAMSGIVTGFLLALARASGETAPLLFTALGNDYFEIGSIVKLGVAQKQSIFAIIGNILEKPVDSLPLTLYKYSQNPNPVRVQQGWAVAMVLMILILLINIIARFWVNRLKAHLQG